MVPSRRRTRLIQPRLQIKMIAAFLGMSTLALLLQFIVFTSSLSELASDLPQDGPLLLERIPSSVLWTALLSFTVLLPMTFMVGVLVTFRVAGPLYRFEVFLKAIIRGEKPADCRLRKGDELHELCELLNQATAALRSRAESGGANTAARPTALESNPGVERAA
jgi:signal peptidase II